MKLRTLPAVLFLRFCEGSGFRACATCSKEGTRVQAPERWDPADKGTPHNEALIFRNPSFP